MEFGELTTRLLPESKLTTFLPDGICASLLAAQRGNRDYRTMQIAKSNL